MKIYFIVAIGFLVGCASSTKQTDLVLAQPPNVPMIYEIFNVPFIKQSAGHCGPATLTMAIQSLGKNATVEQIAAQAFTPGADGAFQSDMIGTARRQGLLAIPVSGMENLLREIAGGNPVIVFENLALAWFPNWHYALVFGYDLPNKTITMHSGPEKSKKWDMRKFERSWKLGDYWGLVVLPPDRLSSSAGELSHLLAASALEQLGKTDAATVAYETILTKWPNSLASLIGLGNIYFAKKNFKRAYSYLSNATELHPGAAVSWHNRAIVEKSMNLGAKARASAQKAIDNASVESALLKSQYEKSLSELL